MADCSKTVDFYNECDRMCDSFTNCKGCPFEIPDGACNIEQDIEYSIEIIQQWSDSHPEPKPKTYADDFFERFPNASKCYFNEKDYVNGNGFPEVKRCNVYGVGIHGCKEGRCTRETQMKCWNEPYKEGE